MCTILGMSVDRGWGLGVYRIVQITVVVTGVTVIKA